MRKILAFVPEFLSCEEILRKWTVAAVFWVIRPNNFLSRKSDRKACILRNERIVTLSKKSIFDLLYSYAHLVHSLVAATHCKLYISLIYLYLNSDDLQRRKRSQKNVVSIENDYWEVMVSVGKILFE